MPLRIGGGVKFVSKLPALNGKMYWDIRVSDLTKGHVEWWHRNVQCYIDTNTSRADVDWDWRLIYTYSNTAAKIFAQKPTGYALGIKDPENNRFIPCGLVQIVARYPALHDYSRKSVFVWYLSTLPSELLPQFIKQVTTDRQEVVEPPKLVGRATVDVAVTHSFNELLEGLVGLHAETNGGEELCHWYKNLGFQNLDKSVLLPVGFRRIRGNDGRYFFLNSENAMLFSRKLDGLRGV